jgi:sugar phosphate isomerase/epimerase
VQLGVYTVLLADMPFEDALVYLTQWWIHTVEFGCGGFSGTAHADPGLLLNDNAALQTFQSLLEKYNVAISALNCSGNPIHPNVEKARSFHETYKNGALLAEKLGVKTVITFSG